MSKNLADNIVALRKKHGLSQEQFAEKIGVTRQAVSNWERRIATPDVETLDLIAKLFDTDLTAMVNGESTGTEKPRDTLRYRRVRLLLRGGEAAHLVGLFYLGMQLTSLTNPGLFCPLPSAMLTVLVFAVLERYMDDPAYLPGRTIR